MSLLFDNVDPRSLTWIFDSRHDKITPTLTLKYSLIVFGCFENVGSDFCGFPTVWSLKCWFRKVREAKRNVSSNFRQHRMAW